MKGFPKRLNSKRDYLFIKNNFSPAEWSAHFQALLDDRMKWMKTRTLTEGESGQTDETHCIVETKNEKGKVIQQDQYELRENHLTKLFRIGFTVAEVEKILNEAQ